MFAAIGDGDAKLATFEKAPQPDVSLGAELLRVGGIRSEDRPTAHRRGPTRAMPQNSNQGSVCPRAANFLVKGPLFDADEFRNQLIYLAYAIVLARAVRRRTPSSRRFSSDGRGRTRRTRAAGADSAISPCPVSGLGKRRFFTDRHPSVAAKQLVATLDAYVGFSFGKTAVLGC